MWIIFALISATILASRKIQEKKLVGDVGGSLGWMIRFGSAIGAGILWIIFSQDFTGLFDWRIWIVIAIIAGIMYPLQMGLYFRAMHELPLSLFGMLAGVAPLSSFLFSRIFLHLPMSVLGLLGIFFVVVGIAVLVYKNEHKDIKIISVFIAVASYMVMGAGSVMDKFALNYTNPYFYAFLNQSVSAIVLFATSYFLSKSGPRLDFFQKNKNLILIIGVSQGISWVLGVHALSWAPNPGYTTALINTHAIITAIYGVLVLKEKVTQRKIFVFLCMILAILSFAFA